MPVLVEAISVVCRIDAIEQKFEDGWDAFARLVPNQTLARDNDLVRVGFMIPDDVKAFVDQLQAHGLQFLVEDQAVDIAVVDQVQGFTSICAWLELAKINLNDAGQQIAVVRLVGTSSGEVAVPDGWVFERSLSSSFGFVPNKHMNKVLKFLRRERNLYVYEDALSGGEVYVGRTAADA
jgi:hypothetical protein